jgi:hypothetical protein
MSRTLSLPGELRGATRPDLMIIDHGRDDDLVSLGRSSEMAEPALDRRGTAEDVQLSGFLDGIPFLGAVWKP